MNDQAHVTLESDRKTDGILLFVVPSSSGRTAAYQGTEVTWSEMFKANEKIELDFKGLKV